MPTLVRFARWALAAALAAPLAWSTGSHAAAIGDAQWHSLGGAPGTDGRPNTAVVGPGNVVYVSGTFSVVDHTPAKNIAKWDGSAWSALGGGLGSGASALAVDSKGNLYAGGYFTSAGGVAVNRVAKWDGTTWSALGAGMNDGVLALAVDGSDTLYAAGRFTTAGGVAANRVARWDGSAWSALGSGMTANVYALVADASGNVYAGGDFTSAGGVAAARIARWDGSAWSALGSGLTGGSSTTVRALVRSGANIYAAGSFTWAGGGFASNVAMWNGTAWSALGSGLGAGFASLPSAYDLAVDVAGNLYAVGTFTTPGSHIAKWNGASWSALGTGVGYFAEGVAADAAGVVYAVGLFTTAGAVSARGLAKWESGDWSTFGTGFDAAVHALTADSAGNIVVGGEFTSAGSIAADRVATWNGSAWSASGSGIGGAVSAVTVDPADLLYAGGSFSTSDGSPATGIAALAGGTWSDVGGGVDGSVRALAQDGGGTVYVGGTFTQAGSVPAANVAAWDGGAWSALGAGTDGIVLALTTDSVGTLYAGGSFTVAGSTSAARVAAWDGSDWRALADGMNGPVYALAVDSTGRLYAGGQFTTAGGAAATGLAMWDGASWSALGAGASPVLALATDAADNLYVGGSFTSAGGVSTRAVALWRNGAWLALGSGVEGSVEAVLIRAGDLWVGGSFGLAGGQASVSAARFDVPPDVSLSVAGPDPTNVSPLVVTAAFTEPVAGLDVEDFVVTNGTPGTLTALVPDRVWTFDVTPTAEGLVAIGLPADAVQASSDGNGNFASKTVSRTYDVSAPTVSIARVSPDPTRASSVTFEVGFDEDVTGVDPADFALHTTGTVVASLAGLTGSGKTYTVMADGVSGDGQLRLDVVDAPSIADLAGNSLAGPYTSGEAFTVDNTAPLPPSVEAIADDTGVASDDAITNDTTLVVTGSAEPHASIEVFRAGTVSMGTTDADASGAWSLDCTGTSLPEGAHTLEAVATDEAGNESGVSTAFPLTIDVTAPAVSSITRANASPTSAGTLVFDVALTEPVAGVDTADFVLGTGGTASGTIASVVGVGATYAVTVGDVAGNGTLRLDLAAAPSIHDTAGNALAGGYSSGDAYVVDDVAPVVTSITRTDASPTRASSVGFHVTVSEPITGLAASDFELATTGTVTGSVTGVVGTGTDWSVAVDDVLGDGTLQLAVLGSASAADAAGNLLLGSLALGESYALDHTAPSVVSITRTGASPTNGQSVAFVVTFSEAVTGVDPTQFALTAIGTANGVVESTSGGGATWSVTVSSVVGDGALRLDVVATPTIEDPVGNRLPGPYAAGASYEVDHSAPPAPSGLYALDDTGTPADGITSDDTPELCGDAEPLAHIEALVGGVEAGSGDADTIGHWCVAASTGVLGDGTHSLTVAAFDAAGNASPLSPPFLVTVDTVAPTASITRVGPSPTNGDAVAFSVVFGEVVYGVGAGDFVVSADGTAVGTIAEASGTGSTYTVTVTGVAGDGVLRLELVPGGTLVDIAGNHVGGGSSPSGDGVEVDHTPPDAPVVTSADARMSNATPTWVWTPGPRAGDGRFRYRLDPAGDAAWTETTASSFTPDAALAVGPHTLEVSERDAAGNWSEPGSFTIEIGDPVIVRESGCGCSTGAPGPGATGVFLLLLVLGAWRRHART